MNCLWNQYIGQLIDSKKDDENTICSKIVKADFSGAKMKVTNAKNHQLIG